MRKKASLLLLPAALLLAALLLSACAAAPAQTPALREPVGVALDTAEVTRGAFYSVAAWEGLVQPRVRELAFPAAGLIAEVNVSVGSRVEEGQVLARLDAEAYTRSLAELREAIAYQTETGALTLRQSELRVEIAKAELAELAERGADTRRKAIEIEELENALQAERALRALDAEELARRAEALEALVASSSITAPCGGTVVFCAAQEGGYALAHNSLIWLADDASAVISTGYISSDAVAKASAVRATVAGEAVEVAYEPMERALYLASRAAGWPLHSTFTVTNAGDAPVENGMAAVVYLVTDYIADALRVPTGALRRDADGSDFVYELVDGAQVRRSVVKGKTNDAYTQIVQGLEEGDVVYVGN